MMLALNPARRKPWYDTGTTAQVCTCVTPESGRWNYSTRVELTLRWRSFISDIPVMLASLYCKTATRRSPVSIRPVKKLIKSKPTLEGAGVHLRRAFGFGTTNDFDPFLLLDDF